MKRKFAIAVALFVAVAFFATSADAAKKKRRHYKKAPAKVEPAPVEVAPVMPPPEPVKEKKHKVKAMDFPEKGWHKGPYLAAHVGMMQLTNDSHIVTDRKFDGTMIPAYGITFGWDVADWIGPLFQLSFGTATDTVGDPNNAAAGVEYPSNPGVTFPAGTFPVEDGRQYAVDIGLFARATLPYFTHAKWQPKMCKILPYLKVGGVGHAVFNKATTAANMGGAFGGGPSVGLGVELAIWKGFFFAVEAQENLIFQQSVYKNITTTVAGVTDSRSYKIIKGGFAPQFQFQGNFGWHF